MALGGSGLIPAIARVMGLRQQRRAASAASLEEKTSADVVSAPAVPAVSLSGVSYASARYISLYPEILC